MASSLTARINRIIRTKRIVLRLLPLPIIAEATMSKGKLPRKSGTSQVEAYRKAIFLCDLVRLPWISTLVMKESAMSMRKTISIASSNFNSGEFNPDWDPPSNAIP